MSIMVHICGRSCEFIVHLFISCKVAAKFWSWLVEEAGIVWVIPQPCSDLLIRKLNGFAGRKRGKVLWNSCTMMALIWSLWLERNARIFEN